jgi:hypothetical protein
MNHADPTGGRVGGVASRVLAKTQLQLKQDLRNIIIILKGQAPEEVQERPATLTRKAEANIPCLGREAAPGGVLVFLLLRRRSDGQRGSASLSLRSCWFTRRTWR